MEATPHRPLRVLVLLALLSTTASAAEIAGVTVPEHARVGTSDLVLNGSGLKKKVIFKVYVAGLYLAEKRQSPADVLALGGAKRLSITLLRSVTAREFVDALHAGIDANSPPEERRVFEDRLGRLAAILLTLGQGNKGDLVTFDWLPGTGIRVEMNGRVRGPTIAGDDLYRALLKVWLGERPTSAGLKRALLGRVD